MVEPTVVARSEHSISRRDIDPDALKVLYRLHEHDYTAYLVGGSVRDLLLGRRPKDFDIGTSAHPHQVKKLFRNCWIIGRRFRLAHVKFGTEDDRGRDVPAPGRSGGAAAGRARGRRSARGRARDAGRRRRAARGAGAAEGTHLAKVRAHDRLIHRDNTFGTPEEDAFRRDFTINALFYDIATFSIIDYVGGLQDLEDRLIRSIGDPGVRFLEDPVRMLRAVVVRRAPRLRHRPADPRRDRRRIATRSRKAAPARLIEEYFKILRSGYAEKSFRHAAGDAAAARDHAGAATRAGPALWESLRAARSLPPALRRGARHADQRDPARHAAGAARPRPGAPRRFSADPLERRVDLGMLPMPRRDVERLHQILALQPRLHGSARAASRRSAPCCTATCSAKR